MYFKNFQVLWSEVDQDGFTAQRMSKNKKNEGYSSLHMSIDCLLKMPVLLSLLLYFAPSRGSTDLCLFVSLT